MILYCRILDNYFCVELTESMSQAWGGDIVPYVLVSLLVNILSDLAIKLINWIVERKKKGPNPEK